MFWDSLVKLLGREKALLWPKKLNIVSKNYQGELFEGNHCRKLIKSADGLLDYQIYEDVGYFKLIPYVQAFKTMDAIVNNCFSKKVKDFVGLSAKILELKKILYDIDVSQSLKIHVLLDHVVESLQYLFNYGLGVWSEQAGESIHREFLKFWELSKINSIESECYVDKLLKAVVNFSSRHL